MAEKITIKDIAREAGVSLSSVHLAMSGKPGVSEETRARVKRIAEKLNYKPNLLASSLKRETLNIAVALPKKDSRSRFYYDFMWDALSDFEAVARDYNLNLVKLAYTNLAQTLNELDLAGIHGLITVGYPEADYRAAICRVSEAGVPVILIDSDLPDSGRICCVQPDTEVVGNLTGELLINTINRLTGKILVCAGNRSYPNHYQIVEALSRYLEQAGVHDRLVIIHFDEADETASRQVREAFRHNQIVGCCSVNSRSTLVLAEELESMGFGHQVPAIGSGLFEEAAPYIKSGVLNASINKHPYEQCLKALNVMTDLLVKNEGPKNEILHVGIEAVFQSTLGQYNQSSFRLVL